MLWTPMETFRKYFQSSGAESQEFGHLNPQIEVSPSDFNIQS